VPTLLLLLDYHGKYLFSETKISLKARGEIRNVSFLVFVILLSFSPSGMSFESILPPHWRQTISEEGRVLYFNEISQEYSETHPYQRYLEASKTIFHRTSSRSRPSTTNTQNTEDFFKDVIGKPHYNTVQGHGISSSDNSQEIRDYYDADADDCDDREHGQTIQYHDIENTNASGHQLYQIAENPSIKRANSRSPPKSPKLLGLPNNSPTQLTNPLLDESSPNKDTKKKGGIKYDFHCQWSERDLFGKVTLYGLTIRFLETGEMMLKFDGIDGEWTFTSLKGPYGCLEMSDLYIGARIQVFGRHLTISSANAAACHWILNETTRLKKQQEEFQKRVESVGQVPCIQRKPISTIRHITRNSKTIGQTNLRQVMKENARLGEQLANLGLAHQISDL
jgi:hypothetical protein